LSAADPQNFAVGEGILEKLSDKAVFHQGKNGTSFHLTSFNIIG